MHVYKYRILTGKKALRHMLMGEFKQAVLRINNKVNMVIFGQGLLEQRVEVLQDKVLIVAKNRRVRVLSWVDNIDRETTEMMDRALINQHKRLFIEMMRDEMGVTVLSHLKDYDPKLEISISVSFFEKPVEELLPLLRMPADD